MVRRDTQGEGADQPIIGRHQGSGYQAVPIEISSDAPHVSLREGEGETHQQGVWDRIVGRGATTGVDAMKLATAGLALGIAAICFGVGIAIGDIRGRTYEHYMINPYSPKDVHPSFTAFHMTDVHLEPLYDKEQVVKGSCRNPACCKYSKCEAFTYPAKEPPTLGCDPPVSLLQSALDAMKSIDRSVNYVFYTGDMPAHHLCTEEMVRTTQIAFMKRITASMPKTHFVYAIGNNDLWPNNRNSEHNFKALYDIMLETCPQCALFSGNKATQEENKETFVKGGYYVFRDEPKRVRVLILNSGLWSPRYDNKDLPKKLPEKHMDWTEKQLGAAKDNGEKVVIISHIPPGHVRHAEDWYQVYLDRYIKICTTYTDIILAQLYGHHSKEYIRSFSADVGVLVSAGMTPLGGGSLEVPGTKDAANPTFRHAIFTKDTFYDMWSFYLDLSTGDHAQVTGLPTAATPLVARMSDKTELSVISSQFTRAVRAAQNHGWDLMYSFRETYKVPDVSANSIHIASQRILHDSHYTARYESYLGGLHSNSRMIACDIHSQTWNSQELEACFDRLCIYDVSQECANYNSRR